MARKDHVSSRENGQVLEKEYPKRQFYLETKIENVPLLK